MSESEILLDYHGQIDFNVIESLITKLKKSDDFTSLSKLAGKRTYSVFVESLDNIYKHSALKSSNDPLIQPHISIRKQTDKILIRASNPIAESSKGKLIERLDKLINLDEPATRTLHEKVINSESKVGENGAGAGLGLITMALKSGNKIAYCFEPLIDGYLCFEIQISLNKYPMRKLIIDKTPGAPKVICDPEKKIYMSSGESRLPDVRDFYNQILSWLEEFNTHISKLEAKKDPVEFNFNFDYFNSSSGKLILDVCKVLAGLRKKGINIIVNWYYEKEDVDMLEAGKEMSKIVKFPFEYIESYVN
jgi:hypothetical protein